MPKIRLEKDDLDSFHRTRAQSTKKSSKKSSSPDEPSSIFNPPSWLAILLLLAIIVGVTSYWSYQQYEVLQQAQSRITDLESRLSATGEDMDQSAAALQIKVSELSVRTEDLWEQMDKLNKTVMALKASTEESAKSLNSGTANNNTSIGLLNEQSENQANLLKQLNTQFSQVSNVDANFEQQIASLREKLISTALANNDLTNQIDDLRRRVVAAEKKANATKALPITTSL
jgi:chromosome segregation ATPase